MNRRLIAAAILVLVLGFQGAVFGQDVKLPATGTIVWNTPLFRIQTETGRRMILMPAGSTVKVLAKDGFWYRVLFSDPRLGDFEGYVSGFDISVTPDDTAQGQKRQVVSQRGHLEAKGVGFAQTAANDNVRAFGDALFREEVFVKPNRWMQLSAGLDVRANSYDQVEDEWRLDFEDRRVLRPRAALRRLTLGIATSHVTADVGRQFIRWGRADILSPTDRFARKDFVNVIETEFLPVTGARVSAFFEGENFEVVWVPRTEPSRLPLLNQRWAVVPAEAAGLTLRDAGSVFEDDPQIGARWTHSGRFEMGVSIFDGSNHLPNIDVQPLSPDTISVTRTYPRLRTFGAETSVPLPWFTVKGEGALFTSPTSTNDEYVLYVIELERQVGEWLFDGGYAGEHVTTSRPRLSFNAERGVARSFIGRAAYTVDPRRSVAIETAIRQNGRGLYAKGEYSQAFGQHWRLTLAAVGIGGRADDFLGQFRRNSHGSATLRLSF